MSMSAVCERDAAAGGEGWGWWASGGVLVDVRIFDFWVSIFDWGVVR